MFQSKLFVDLDTEDVLSRMTRQAGRTFAALEERVHEDERITFVLRAEGFVDTFEAQLAGSPRVSEVQRLGETKLLITKEATGALPVIRDNHGKLNGIDLIHGTKRIFSVLTFRRTDVRDIVNGLDSIGTVRLDRLVSIHDKKDVLSPRQREAILLAYEEGYYGWPRDIEAVDLAEQMDIAHSTYLEHLRKAEYKLIQQSLQDDVATIVSEERRFLDAPTEQ